MKYKPLSLDGTLDAKNLLKMSPVRFQISSTKDECLLFPFLGEGAARGKSLPHKCAFLYSDNSFEKLRAPKPTHGKLLAGWISGFKTQKNRKSVAIESHMTGTTSNPAIRGPNWLLLILSCGSVSPDIN